MSLLNELFSIISSKRSVSLMRLRKMFLTKQNLMIDALATLVAMRVVEPFKKEGFIFYCTRYDTIEDAIHSITGHAVSLHYLLSTDAGSEFSERLSTKIQAEIEFLKSVNERAEFSDEMRPLISKRNKAVAEYERCERDVKTARLHLDNIKGSHTIFKSSLENTQRRLEYARVELANTTAQLQQVKEDLSLLRRMLNAPEEIAKLSTIPILPHRLRQFKGIPMQLLGIVQLLGREDLKGLIEVARSRLEQLNQKETA